MAIDPATIAALAGLGDVGGSIFGSIFGGDDRARARQIIAGTQAESPELASEDPELRRKQLLALQQMYDVATQGGMDPQAKAALQQAQAQTAAAERGARGAIVQNAQARGLGGSGAEFLGTLANQQGAATRNALAGTQAAGDARTRALQAMAGSATGFGGVRGSDLDRARAASAVQQFNAQQRLRKAGMMAGQYADEADRTASLGGGIGSALGAGLGAYGSSAGWFDPNKKKAPPGVVGIEP